MNGWNGILDRMDAISRFYRVIAADEDPVVGVAPAPVKGISQDDAGVFAQVAMTVLGLTSESDPYWVSAEMLDVAEHAAKTFPWQSIKTAPMSSSSGYLEFERPVVQAVDVEFADALSQRQLWAPISGIVWRKEGDLVFISSLVHKDDPTFQHELAANFPDEIWRFPMLVHYASTAISARNLRAPDAESERWGCFLGALWTLMAQRIATTHHIPAERHERRRWVRAGRDDPPEIRLIKLRRFRETEHHDGGPVFVEWQHRWIVNGHWRMQWYPSLQDHAPIWIAPYIKGPEDKPLVMKRDIRALVR